MQTIGEAIYQAAFKFEDKRFHPKENSKIEIKLPFSIRALIDEDPFYQNHPLMIEDMKAVYNCAIRDAIQRIKSEYSFMPKLTDHVQHLINIIEENMIDM